MAKRMLIDAQHPEETRVIIADEKQIYDFDFVSAAKKQLKGNIYLAKITRVEPSLQAAFVEYGGGKQGFLPFSEIHPDYYQIPVSDRKRLMEEEDESESEDDDAAELPASEKSSDTSPADDASSLPIDETPASEQERPAYLTEGAIDVSISEDAPLPEEFSSPEEPTPAMPLPEQAELPDATSVPFTEGESISTEGMPPAKEERQTGGESAAEGVETIPNEEEEIQNRRKKTRFSRRYKIQEVVRRGQIVLVQVIKEERGNKGVSLTTYLSLAGRYCVLMPNSPKDGGISRKIASAEDRKRLKAISTELKLAAGMSAIIRTAGMDRTRAEIKRDYDYLVKVWNQIREDTLQSNAPALIYEESDIIKRAIRDQYTNDIDEIVIEGDAAYQAAKDFMKLLMASHTARVKQYDEPTPLFYAYNIEDQLLSMHDPVVKLRSGGYIVINPTEALISIDVNSGRSTGERNIEETATKTNLEAAAEVARQLRLRDLAGLIVIDFIDMLESRNRRAVEKALKDALKLDRAKIQLGRISPFGLLEMSRQRLRPSISETNMVQCQHCIGRGYIRSNESMSIQMIRALEKEASTGSWGILKLIAPQEVALHLLNTKRSVLRTIEERYSVTIQVAIDPGLTSSDYNLEKMRRPQNDRHQNSSENRRPRRHERTAEDAPIEMEASPEDNGLAENIPSETSESQRGEGFNNGERNKRGRRRGGRGRRRSNERPVESTDSHAGADMASNDNASDTPVAAENRPERPEGESERRPRRNRGGRGRRPWRDKDNQESRHGARKSGNAAPPPAAPSDGNTLPAFATENRLPVSPPPQREPQVVNAPPVMQSTPRDPNAPPKKGWWQKMIDLDD